MIISELTHTVERARDYLDVDARRETIDFIQSQWNRDGGVRGKLSGSDLYYTAFAAMCMRALNGPVPRLRLWFYLRSFDDGRELDIPRLFCLIRLRTLLPMTKKTRERLMASLAVKEADTATDMFFRVVMSQFLDAGDLPETALDIQENDNTSDVAAAVVLNGLRDKAAEAILMKRNSVSGGFYGAASLRMTTIEATAKALYALRVSGADLSSLRGTCLDYIESMRQENGGYAAHEHDDIPDVEQTFYALLGIGCLMGSP